MDFVFLIFDRILKNVANRLSYIVNTFFPKARKVATAKFHLRTTISARFPSHSDLRPTHWRDRVDIKPKRFCLRLSGIQCRTEVDVMKSCPAFGYIHNFVDARRWNFAM